MRNSSLLDVDCFQSDAEFGPYNDDIVLDDACCSDLVTPSLSDRLTAALAHVAYCRSGLALIARERLDIEVYTSKLLPDAVKRGLDLEFREAADKYEDAHEKVDALLAEIERLENECPF